jgi:hypothetical protein
MLPADVEIIYQLEQPLIREDFTALPPRPLAEPTDKSFREPTFLRGPLAVTPWYARTRLSIPDWRPADPAVERQLMPLQFCLGGIGRRGMRLAACRREAADVPVRQRTSRSAVIL